MASSSKSKWMMLASLLMLMGLFIYLVAEPVSEDTRRSSEHTSFEDSSASTSSSSTFAERAAAKLSEREAKKPRFDPDAELDFFKGPRPLTRHQLGRRAWGFLHTMASNYVLEENETEADKLLQIFDFLQLWAKLYPCRVCGGHFKEMIDRSPPPLNGTKSDFEVWLCERHNEVNKRTEKQVFDCSLPNIRKRYVQTDGCPVN